MRAIRGMSGVIAVLWAVIQSIPACWGAPVVQNSVVTPYELRAGLGYRVDLYTSSDVTSILVQVDLRPTSSQVFRLVPTMGSSGPGGKRWTAVGQVPADLHPAPGAEATFRVIAMDALRSQVRVNFTKPLTGALECDGFGSYGPAGLGGLSACRSRHVLEVGRTLDRVVRIDLLELGFASGGGGTQVSVDCPEGYTYCLENDNDGLGNSVKLGVLERVDCEGHWETYIEWLDTCQPSIYSEGGVRRGIRHWVWVVTREPSNGGLECPLNWDEPIEGPCCPGYWESTVEWGECGDDGIRRGVRHHFWIVTGEARNGYPIWCPPNWDEPVEEPCLVDCQWGPWENTGVCDMTTGKELWRRQVLVPAQNGGAECDGPTEEWRDSWRVTTVLWDPPWTMWSGECVDGIERGYELKWTEYKNCAGEYKSHTEAIWYERPCPVDCVMDIDWKPIGDCDAQTGQQWWELPVVVPARNGGECPGPIRKLGFCRIICDEWGGYEPWSNPAPWEFPFASNGCVSPILVRAGKSLDLVHRIDVLEVTWAGGELSQGCDAQYDYCLNEQDDRRGNAVKLGVVEKQDCEGYWESWIEWGECRDEGIRPGVRHWIWVIIREPRNGGQECPPNWDEPVQELCSVDCLWHPQAGLVEYGPCLNGRLRKVQWWRVVVDRPSQNGGRECPSDYYTEEEEDCDWDDSHP